MNKFLSLNNSWLLMTLLFVIYVLIGWGLFPITVLPLEHTLHLVDFLNRYQLALVITSIILTTTLAYYCAQSITKFSLKTIFIIIAVISLPFVFSYPGDANDFFTNLWFSERVINFGENPYVQGYVPTNEMYANVSLPTTSPAPFLPYGPVWLAVQIGLYSLVQNLSVTTIVLVFKIVQYALWLMSVGVLLRLFQQARPKLLAHLVALLISPWMLFAMVSNAHNDLWVLLLLSLAVSFFSKQKFLTGVLILLTSVYIKYITLILVPFFVLYWYQKEKTSRFYTQIIPLGSLFLASMVIFEARLHIINGIIKQTELTGFSILSAASFAFPLSPIPFFLKSLLGPLCLVFLIWQYIIFVRHKNNSFAYVTNISALVMSVIFFAVTHLWGYWYLSWIVPLLLNAREKIFTWLLWLGSVHLICFFGLWYAFKLGANDPYTYIRFLLVALILMGVLTASLMAFSSRLWIYEKET